MRGIRSQLLGHGSRPRISPAHAGNTPPRPREGPVLQDQPRTCGEYLEYDGRQLSDQGSAPHMRGILTTPLRLLEAGGISPAHAGNT